MSDGEFVMWLLVASVAIACGALLLEQLLRWVLFGSDVQEGGSRG